MTTSASPVVSELRTLAEVESAALKLSLAERLELVKLLVGTIDAGETLGDDRRWLEEFERRVYEIRQGIVIGRDGDTVMREALARFS
jgi:hypothetical protein